MDTVGMEYQIKFTYIFKTFVEGFHKNLDQIQYAQIRFLCIDCEYKVKGSIMSVD